MYTKLLTRLMALMMMNALMSTNAMAVNAVEGYNLFHTYCFVCHGSAGKGDGPLVKKLTTKPANLARSDRVKKKNDKELFRIIQGTAPHGTVGSEMPGWGLTLAGPQINSLVAYIRFLNLDRHELPGDPELGMRVYKKSCSACHGVDGKGSGPMTQVIAIKPADHTHSARMDAISNDRLRAVISNGSSDASLMPGWKGVLSAEEINAVISYIRLISAH